MADDGPRDPKRPPTRPKRPPTSPPGRPEKRNTNDFLEIGLFGPPTAQDVLGPPYCPQSAREASEVAPGRPQVPPIRPQRNLQTAQEASKTRNMVYRTALWGTEPPKITQRKTDWLGYAIILAHSVEREDVKQVFRDI